MWYPESPNTVVYAALLEFCGIVLYPTEFVPSAVQLERFQEDGVPSVGDANTGEVIVCTPVNVFAASVLAIVAEVEGKVIVVPSVPAKVSELEKLPFLPVAAETFDKSQFQLFQSVPEASLHHILICVNWGSV